MKRIIASLFLVTALVSCKEEKATPKVIYEEGKSKVENTVRDTASFKVADLPILMEGTQYLIHPIGDVRVYDTDSKAYGSSKTNQVSYAISNYNRFEITGYFDNLNFQHIDSTSVKPLTTDKIQIQRLNVVLIYFSILISVGIYQSIHKYLLFSFKRNCF